ncbi:pantoate--beta-alanine ligase [Jonesia quinghaiensis]|uniref:pantoate--beta-alanine ligase n=1 Tax=Jonesia quinghaiensis TaxID=262806 RepID=UPI0004220ECD|nr:pantoate--beta-alanine ligase [Jonesia quinghaiensis]
MPSPAAVCPPPRPHTVHTVAELHDALHALSSRVVGDSSVLSADGTDDSAKPQGRRAVVMTMGALHSGHMELVRAARAQADHVVVTIFVNPLQFGPGEDFDAYPRNVEADLAMLAHEGVDLVFAPDITDMYPDQEPLVRVTAGHLGGILEGAARPGHFDGMLTVVLKLLLLTTPDIAFFGEKDAQQLLLIRRMVKDFNLDVEIEAVPIVRDPSGLALSSRNAYLTAAEHDDALTLSHVLHTIAEVAARGSTPDEALSAGRDIFAKRPHIDVDYLVLVDPHTIAEVDSQYCGVALALVAARVGRTRLIDNRRITFAQ